MKKIITYCISIISLPLFISFSSPQPDKLIEVADFTLKISGVSEELFYYAFSEGDVIVFSFEEVNGKELKEIEISEFSGQSRFMDYKTKKITDKKISITQTGIYTFRLSNSAILGRICKVHIQRIPKDDTAINFNTAVYWKIQYDTVYYTVQERYLLKTDSAFISVMSQVAKISSQNALNGNSNKTIVDFSLPDNTVSWSYYLGVGNEGRKEFNDATDRFTKQVTPALLRIPGYGILGALALNGISYFNKVQGEDNVKYWFLADWNSVEAFNASKEFYQYKQGDVVNDAARMTAPRNGKVYLGLLNDNIMDPIEVMVKVNALTVTQVYATRPVKKYNVTSRKEPYLKN